MAVHEAPRSLGFSRQEYWSGLPFPSPMHESGKWSRSVMSDPQRPHGLQPSRLLHPWDFPGRSTGVGCHCLLWRVPFKLPLSWKEGVPYILKMQAKTSNSLDKNHKNFNHIHKFTQRLVLFVNSFMNPSDFLLELYNCLQSLAARSEIYQKPVFIKSPSYESSWRWITL